ncbi:hypothetical protein EIQ10_05065 [Xanthomonas campestris pv. campestris]
MRNNEHTRALLPCRGWSAQACIATQELPSLALPCFALCRCCALLALLCTALRFALPCSRSSGAPYRSGKAGRYNPQGGAQGCATFL